MGATATAKPALFSIFICTVISASIFKTLVVVMYLSHSDPVSCSVMDSIYVFEPKQMTQNRFLKSSFDINANVTTM